MLKAQRLAKRFLFSLYAFAWIFLGSTMAQEGPSWAVDCPGLSKADLNVIHLGILEQGAKFLPSEEGNCIDNAEQRTTVLLADFEDFPDFDGQPSAGRLTISVYTNALGNATFWATVLLNREVNPLLNLLNTRLTEEERQSCRKAIVESQAWQILCPEGMTED